MANPHPNMTGLMSHRWTGGAPKKPGKRSINVRLLEETLTFLKKQPGTRGDVIDNIVRDYQDLLKIVQNL